MINKKYKKTEHWKVVQKFYIWLYHTVHKEKIMFVNWVKQKKALNDKTEYNTTEIHWWVPWIRKFLKMPKKICIYIMTCQSDNNWYNKVKIYIHKSRIGSVYVSSLLYPSVCCFKYNTCDAFTLLHWFVCII